MPSSWGSSNPGIDPISLVSPALQADSLPTELPRKPIISFPLCSYFPTESEENSKRGFHSDLVKLLFRVALLLQLVIK